MNPKLLLLTLLLALTLAACTPARSEPGSGSEASAPSSQAEELPSEPSSSGSESHSDPAALEESSAPDWAAEGFAEGVTAYRSGELSDEEWQAFLESQPDFVWLRQYDLWPFGYKEGYYEFDADWAYLKFSSEEELPRTPDPRRALVEPGAPVGVPGTLPHRGSGSSSLWLCQKSGGAGHHRAVV